MACVLHVCRYAGLPSAWDWRDVDGVDYVPRVRSQGQCGACYASATLGMLESRLAIASSLVPARTPHAEKRR